MSSLSEAEQGFARVEARLWTWWSSVQHLGVGAWLSSVCPDHCSSISHSCHSWKWGQSCHCFVLEQFRALPVWHWPAFVSWATVKPCPTGGSLLFCRRQTLARKIWRQPLPHTAEYLDDQKNINPLKLCLLKGRDHCGGFILVSRGRHKYILELKVVVFIRAAQKIWYSEVFWNTEFWQNNKKKFVEAFKKPGHHFLTTCSLCLD